MKKINRTIVFCAICLVGIVFFNACKDDENDYNPALVQKTSSPQWETPVETSYEYNMTYTSQIAFDGSISKNTDTKVAAYAGDECRGTASLLYEPDFDVYVFNLTIYSNEPSDEQIIIKAYNPKTGWLYKKPLTISFSGDKAMGDVDDILDCLSK